MSGKILKLMAILWETHIFTSSVYLNFNRHDKMFCTLTTGRKIMDEFDYHILRLSLKLFSFSKIQSKNYNVPTSKSSAS